MSELDRLKQRLGISTPNEQYKDRNLGTYKPYYSEEEEEKKKREAEQKVIEEREQKQKELQDLKTRREQDALSLDFNTLSNMVRDKAPDKGGGGRKLDSLSDPRMQSHNYREYALSRTEKEFERKLIDDINNSEAYANGLGIYAADRIKETMMPLSYKRDVTKRLEGIEKALREGPEKGGYKMQEGWLEMEIGYMQSQEAYKEAEGLPNQRKEIDKWIEEHPELGLSAQDRNLPQQFLDVGVRGGGSFANLLYNSALDAATDPTTYWLALASMVAGAALAPVTAGTSMIGATALSGALLGGKTVSNIANMSKLAKGSVAVKIPRTAKWLSQLSTLGAMQWGMSGGRFRSMAVMQGYDTYGEMIDNGTHPAAAKAIAETLGTANAVIEYLQIDTLAKVAPGVKELAKRAEDLAGKDLKSKMLKTFMELGIDFAAEDLEEVWQEHNTMLIGEVLSEYLREAPNPDTWGGLQAMAKTMTTEAYRDRMVETAITAAQNLWLIQFGGQAGGYVGNRVATKVEQSAAKKKVYGYYTQEEKATQEYFNETKELLLGKSKLVDQLIIDAINNKSEETISALSVLDMNFEDMEKSPNLSNQDREMVVEARRKIKEALGQVEYDLKVENPNIKLEPRNRQEIEFDIIEGNKPYHIQGMNEVVVEKRQEAIDKGLYETIIKGLRSGQKKTEISNAVEKLLNWKEKDAFEIGRYITAIETFEAEVRYQYNLAALNNLQEIQQGLKKQAPQTATTPQENEGDIQVGQEAEQAATEPQTPPAESKEVEPEMKLPEEPVEVVDGKFKPSDVMTMPVSDIRMDQKRFQFRINGTTDKLEGITWNDDLAGVLTVWEDEYGDHYVVNGHHRLERMQQLGVKEARVKVLRGMTAEEARAHGALINIAEGSADAFDVSKYMRDTGASLDNLIALGVPPKSKIARDGAALAKLNDDLFRMATTRHIPYERAVMIGRELGGDKDGQTLFYNMMTQEEAKKGYIKDSTVQEMLSRVRSIGATEYFQDSFLGNDLRSAVVERAELVAHVKDNLKNKKSVLKKISKARNAMMLEQMGNVIKQEDNVKEMEAADQALYLLDKTVNYTGSKVGKIFDELAIEYAKTKDKKIFDKALKIVGDLMKTGELLREATGKEEAKAAAVEATQEELQGQSSLLGENFAQIKKGPVTNMVVNKGAAKETVSSLKPIVDAMQKNPLFNNVRVVFTGDDAVRTMTREELDNAGYFNQPEGQVTVYGYYQPVLEEKAAKRGNQDNARREDTGDSSEYQDGDNALVYTAEYEIGINNGATPDTLLHEAIHHIQTVVADVNPELYALIDRWENDVNAKAAELGIELPQGQELLANVLTISEYGYASDDPGLANLVAVDQDIIDNVATLLGNEFMDLTRGKSKALKTRKITNALQNFAVRNLQDAEGMLASKQRAIDRRLNKIRMDLRDGRPVKYYSSDSTTYAIVKPKGTEFEVSFFNELGLLSTETLSLKALSDRLRQKMIIFNKPEISNQIKTFNRDQIDDIYTRNAAITNDNAAGIKETFRLFENARVGNLTASDYDNIVKDKLNEAERNDILNMIYRASLKGFDKANKDVSIREYVNRFYPTHLGVPSSQNEVRLREVDGKIERYMYDYLSYTGKADETLPIRVTGVFDTAEKAIENERYQDDLGIDYYKQNVFPKRFSYMPDYWDTLMEEYKDFTENYETVRNDYNVEFDGRPKYTVQYQLKSFIGDNEHEVLYYGKTEIIKNPTDAEYRQMYQEVKRDYPQYVANGEGVIRRTFDNEGNTYIWKATDNTHHFVENFLAKTFGKEPEEFNQNKHFQVKAPVDTNNFKRWFKNSKVVDEDGKPLVVYHGTTHSWEVFDIGRTFSDNHFGKGFYASSSYYDSQMNYLSDGGDLKNRISSLADQLADYDDYALQDLIQEHYGVDVYADDFDITAYDYEDLARKMLDGGEEIVMEVYLSIQNPLRLDRKGGTIFTLEMSDEQQARIAEIEALIAGETDDDRINELEDELDDVYAEADYTGGNAAELLDAIREVAPYWDVDADNLIQHLFEQLDFYSGETAYNVLEAIFNWDYIHDIYDYDNDNAGDRQFAQEIFREMKYDGIIYEDAKNDFFPYLVREEGTKHYIVFNPTQIKSVYNTGAFNEYDPNINYQIKSVSPAVKVDGFYSKLEQVLNEKMGSRGKATDILNMLQKNGVKPEELEWFRIAEFLQGKDMVTKAEILEHMQTRRIEFERAYGEANFIGYTLHRGQGSNEFNFIYFKYINNPDKPFIYSPHFGNVDNPIGDIMMTTRTDAFTGELIYFIEELQSDWHQKGQKQGYTTPEMAKRKAEISAELDKIMGKVRAQMQEQDKAIDNFNKVGEPYNSLDNMISRYSSILIGLVNRQRELISQVERGEGNERPIFADPGTTWTAIEELDDVNARIRKYGTKIYEASEEQKTHLPAYIEANNLVSAERAKLRELQAEQSRLWEEYNNIGADTLPDAPLKESIIDFLLKASIKDAVERGISRVAFSTGEQVADKYSMLQVADTLVWEQDETYPEGKGYFWAEKNGEVVFSKPTTEDKLRELIGSGLAEKLLSQPAAEGTNTKMISGDDMQIGGIFHQKLYNNYIPRMLKKYLKKWGVELEEIDMGSIPDPNIRAILEYTQNYDFAQSIAVIEALVKKMATPDIPYIAYIDRDGRDQRSLKVIPIKDYDGGLRILWSNGDYVWRNDAYIYNMNVEFRESPPITKQLSFEINNQMREAILKEGQPLFQVKGNIAAADVSVGELMSILALGKLPMKSDGMLTDRSALKRDIRLLYRPDIEEQEEAKVSDIEGVLLPKDVAPEVIQALKDIGIHFTETYTRGKREDKLKILDKNLDMRLQLKKGDTNNQAFKDWFKDSYVKNADGTPMVLYHGTRKGGFNIFQSDHDHNSRVAIYFSNLKAASSYSGGSTTVITGFKPETAPDILDLWVDRGGDYEVVYENARTGEVEYDVDFDDGDTWMPIYRLIDADRWQIGDFTEEELEEFGPDLFDSTNLPIKGVYPVYLSMQNPLVIEGDGAYWMEIPWEIEEADGSIRIELVNTNDAAAMAYDLGYDGVIFKNIYDYGGALDANEEVPHDVYVVFKPTQIKPVYNRGTWSATNPDIYYQVKNGPDTEERSWGQTVRDANITEDWLRELLLDNKFMYEVKHNEDSLIAAAQLLNRKGEAYVLARLKSSLEADAVLFAASQILTFKYMESGEREYAMDILALTAEKATTAGQAIQILSVWNKQTPEGMLRNVRKQFDNLATEAQKKELEDLHKQIQAEARRINKAAVTKLKIKRATERLAKMKQEEMDNAVIAADTELTSKKLRGEKVETPKKTENIENMAEAIMKVVTDHYDGAPGSLLNKLKELGLNDFEARELAKFTELEMKALTESQNLSFIQKLFKKKDAALDKQLSDVMAEGKYGEAMKLVIGQKKKIPVLTQEMANHIYERGKEINALPEGSRERLVAAARLIRDITEAMPVGIGQKLATFQTIMQLLNIKTLMRNWLGNGMFRKIDTFAMNVLGAPIDIIYSKVFNTNQRTHLFRLMDAHKAQKEGYKEGWKHGLQDALEGITTMDDDIGKLELRSARTFRRNTPIGQLETLLNIGMRATDRAAFTASYKDSLIEQMQIAGVTAPTPEMHDIAVAIGLYRTFNDKTALSEALGGIKKNLNKIGYKGFGLGELILKYPKTPANILGRAVDYSPAGLLVTMFKLASDTSGSSYLKQRMAVEGISRALIGSGGIAIGMILARLGVLTGSVPDDDEDETVYNLKKQAGLRDYSVNTSAIFRYFSSGFAAGSGELREGDVLASYDWAEPLAMGWAIGADYVLGEGQYTQLDALSSVVRAWEVGVTTLAEQPVLTGLANAFRYGDVTEGITQAVMRMPASFSPSVLNQVAQVIDGRATDPYTLYDKSAQAWNVLKNRIPGLRNSLPGRIDVLGDNQTFYEQDEALPLRILKAMVSPSIMTTYAPTEEMELLLDLYAESGIREALPRAPQKQYTLDGVTYKPTPEEYEAMAIWLGTNSKKAIKNALGGYAKYRSPESQAEEIKDLLGSLRAELKIKFIRGDFR